MTTPTGHHAPAGLTEEVTLPPSGPGTVVLDIGGDAGALVVSTSARLVGAEIEIRADGDEWRGTHTAVRERRVAGRVQYAGVFPRLDAGEYELRVLGDHRAAAQRIHVGPGVATETWLDAPGA